MLVSNNFRVLKVRWKSSLPSNKVQTNGATLKTCEIPSTRSQVERRSNHFRLDARSPKNFQNTAFQIKNDAYFVPPHDEKTFCTQTIAQFLSKHNVTRGRRTSTSDRP